MESNFQCSNMQDLHQSEEIYKKPKKQSNQQNSINSGQWTQNQNLKYIIFIDKNRLSLASRSKRRIGKVFKQMAIFLNTRNSIQCRSHHQKQLEKFKNNSKIINFFKNEYGQQLYNQRLGQFNPTEVKSSQNNNNDEYAHSPEQMNVLQGKSQSFKSVEIQTDMAGLQNKIILIQKNQTPFAVPTFQSQFQFQPQHQHQHQHCFTYFPTFNWQPSFFQGP